MRSKPYPPVPLSDHTVDVLPPVRVRPIVVVREDPWQERAAQRNDIALWTVMVTCASIVAIVGIVAAVRLTGGG